MCSWADIEKQARAGGLRCRSLIGPLTFCFLGLFLVPAGTMAGGGGCTCGSLHHLHLKLTRAYANTPVLPSWPCSFAPFQGRPCLHELVEELRTQLGQLGRQQDAQPHEAAAANTPHGCCSSPPSGAAASNGMPSAASTSGAGSNGEEEGLQVRCCPAGCGRCLWGRLPVSYLPQSVPKAMPQKPVNPPLHPMACRCCHSTAHHAHDLASCLCYSYAPVCVLAGAAAAAGPHA